MPSINNQFNHAFLDKSSRSIFSKDRADMDKEERYLDHALNTYLNVTGPGQYNLPNTTYGR